MSSISVSNLETGDDMTTKSGSERAVCPGRGCGRRCCGWTRRNWIHVILLATALAALVGAILGSLDSCNTEIRNVTVTTTVPVTRTFNVTRNVTREVSRNVTRDVSRNVTIETEIIAPLATMVLLDDSGSMSCDASVAGSNSWCNYCCQAGGSTSCCAGNAAGTNCYDTASCDSRMEQAKTNLPGLFNALNDALNNATANQTNNFHGGLTLWGWQNSMTVVQSLTTDMDVLGTQISTIDIPEDGTMWTQSLCQCYNDLTSSPVLTEQGGNGMCVLIADGDNAQGDPHDQTACAATLNAIDAIYGAGTEASYTTHESMETFLKSQNITIFSILVGYADGWEKMFPASSCDDYATCQDATFCNDPTQNTCPYYLYLDNFDELQSKLESIASQQRSVASRVETRTETVVETVVETVTDTVIDQETTVENVTTSELQTEVTEGSVSVCSLDFLYALLALFPSVFYLVYRVVVIKAKSKTIRRQLYAMIRSQQLTRQDLSHFATVATNLLLPANFKSDVDWVISYVLFQCPCLLPASKADLEDVFAASTIAL